ncbi:acyltransferase domain-containing protein [Actinoplanes sp. NPDC049316]|uniref:acyltransferase domain-containing protein n=1 Tax=Actinoplanes sp. NPDC049316 TaxID=3154727 RepID=UPI003424EC98
MDERRVALLFPGTGAQYPAMAAGLYGTEPVFTAAVEEVLAAFGGRGDLLRADWLEGRPIDHVTRSTPLLFAVDYALGRLVLSWGVRPAALLGHSIGEIVAATLAGVFEVADIARVIAVRARHLADAPPGSMLAVAAGPDDVAPYLGGDLVVGAVNAPRQVVLSGPADRLALARTALRDDGWICRPVPALSPFHSPAMRDVAARGADLYTTLRPRPPRLPVYSAYLGRLMTAGDATDPGFWIGQPAAPVLFWPALEALLDGGSYHLVEAGPGDGLTTLARQHPAVRDGFSVTTALLPFRRKPGRGDAGTAALARDRLTALTPAG